MNRRLAIGIGTAAAVLTAGGGVAVLARSSSPTPRAAAATEAVTTIAPDPAATTPAVHATSDELDLVPAGGTAATFALPQRSTRRFSMLSVSWTDPAAKPRGTVQVRTRNAKTRAWSGWQDLGISEDGADLSAEAGRARGRTDPLWAAGSDGVAARLVAAPSAAPVALPAGLRLRLIDPDATTPGGQGGGEPDATISGGQGGGEPVPSTVTTGPEDGPSAPAEGGEVTPEPTNPPVTDVPTVPTTVPVPTGTTDTPPTTAPNTPAPTTTTTVAPTTPATTAPTPLPSSTVPVKAQLPPYVPRAGWGADEKLVTDPISVAPQAKMVWVHHTGFAAGSCAESAAVVRSIQKNDVADGLSDMGYNFLVDKCGTLFEGRRGSVTQAVIGAHIIGFNTGSVGVALLGDYRGSNKPSTAALTTIAQVAAARLGAYGFNPTTTASMTEGVAGMKWPKGTSVVFPRISGHGDGYATLCPGANLAAALPSIRARSVQMITGLAARSIGGGIYVGSVFHVRTAVSVSWSVTTATSSLARWEMLLDGRVAATLPAAARSGSLTLKPGSHTVAVRAVHVQGGIAVTPAYHVVADVTAPTFPVVPNPVLRTGTYSATYAPVTVGYRAADNVKVYTVVATAPARVNLPPAGTAWYTGMRPGAVTTFAMTARDPAGNVRTSSIRRTTRLLAETSARRTGVWTARSAGAYLGGKALTASRKNAKLTYTFTGRSAALLFSRGPKTGRADVFVDGRKAATVDTRATKSAYRQALWVRALTPGKHTVVVVVAGTGGRPSVVSDGLAYLG